MSGNYLLREAELGNIRVKCGPIRNSPQKGTNMTRSPEHVIALMTLLCGFACGPAGAAPVAILAPAQQDTIHDNSGTLAVEVKVEPPIEPRDGRSIRILLDGKRAAPDSSGMSFTLQGLERGEHWLQALLIDRKGQTLSVSDTVHFTMWQASTNSTARQKK
jgi:hypothetical protein